MAPAWRVPADVCVPTRDYSRALKKLPYMVMFSLRPAQFFVLRRVTQWSADCDHQ